MKNALTLLVATVVLFVWNAISWMALPFHSNSLKNMPDGALAENITELMPESGIYHYPGLPEDGRSEAEIVELRNNLDQLSAESKQLASIDERLTI